MIIFNLFLERKKTSHVDFKRASVILNSKNGCNIWDERKQSPTLLFICLITLGA